MEAWRDRAQCAIPAYSRGWIRLLAQSAGIVTDPIPAWTDAGPPSVADTALRQALSDDPAMAALLPLSPCAFASASLQGEPFHIPPGGGPVLLPVTLVDDPSALAAAARWAVECWRFRAQGWTGTDACASLARHGRALFARLPAPSAQALGACLPADVAQALRRAADEPQEPCAISAWLAPRLSAGMDAPVADIGRPAPELSGTVEDLLLAGGDSRLLLDPHTGLNRYGVPPRPRPEAIHFSSSTASPVSEHGFQVCELFRRALQFEAVGARRGDAAALRALIDAAAREMLDLMGLSEADADLALTASGTDTELLAVLLARSAEEDRGVTNVLVAPEEVGRGVLLAGAGRWFDALAAGGERVEVGAPVWEGEDIPVVGVPVRAAHGSLRAVAAVRLDFVAACAQAVAQGRRVLAHAVLCSKTGIEAPGEDALDEVRVAWPGRVDVVVDACQLRAGFRRLGDLVRRGCLVQITGSKFLTGPPFSGALVVPRTYAARDRAVEDALRRTPGAGRPGDWLKRWPSGELDGARTSGYGPVFRWLPALLEARLFEQLPGELRAWAFERFRRGLLDFIAGCPTVRLIDAGSDAAEAADHAPANYIFAFEVLACAADGRRGPLSGDDCQRLFRLLNRDCSMLLDALSTQEADLARQCVHLGQPVTLGCGDTAITVLRFVLGARFFNAVGHRQGAARQAMLESEIRDAQRAIAKIELLAGRWAELTDRHADGGGG